MEQCLRAWSSDDTGSRQGESVTLIGIIATITILLLLLLLILLQSSWFYLHIHVLRYAIQNNPGIEAPQISISM